MNSRRPQWLTIIFLILALSTIAIQIRAIANNPGRVRDGVAQLGTPDFKIFWAAYYLEQRGENPYDFSTLERAQRELFDARGELAPYPHPPWNLTILSPLLVLPYVFARWGWVVLNLCFLFGSAFVWSKLKPELRLSNLERITLPILFVPGIMTIWSGNLSLLLLFSIVTATWALSQKRRVLSGVFLATLAMKPHVFVAVVPLLVINAVRTRTLSHLFSAGAFFLLLAGLSEVNFPGIYSRFLQYNSSPLIWATPTTTSVVRHLLWWMTGELPAWPAFVIPAVGFFGVSVFLIRYKSIQDLAGLLPPILALSIIFTPYCWPNDFSLLMPLYLEIISSLKLTALPPKKRWLCTIALWSAQLAPVFLGYVTDNLELHFWYPHVLLMIWWFVKPDKRRLNGGAGFGVLTTRADSVPLQMLS